MVAGRAGPGGGAVRASLGPAAHGRTSCARRPARRPSRLAQAQVVQPRPAVRSDRAAARADRHAGNARDAAGEHGRPRGRRACTKRRRPSSSRFTTSCTTTCGRCRSTSRRSTTSATRSAIKAIATMQQDAANVRRGDAAASGQPGEHQARRSGRSSGTSPTSTQALDGTGRADRPRADQAGSPHAGQLFEAAAAPRRGRARPTPTSACTWCSPATRAPARRPSPASSARSSARWGFCKKGHLSRPIGPAWWPVTWARPARRPTPKSTKRSTACCSSTRRTAWSPQDGQDPYGNEAVQAAAEAGRGRSQPAGRDSGRLSGRDGHAAQIESGLVVAIQSRAALRRLFAARAGPHFRLAVRQEPLQAGRRHAGQS